MKHLRLLPPANSASTACASLSGVGGVGAVGLHLSTFGQLEAPKPNS